MSRGVGWDLWTKKFAPIDTRVTSLEDTYVRAHWFESVSSGTSGTIAAPVTGATFVLDQWSAGVDALVSTVSSGMPTFVSPVDSGGTVITATFDSAGAYVLSGTPTAYPVAVIFVYRCKFKYFDDTLSLFEAELENTDIAKNTAARHTQGTDTTLGTQAEDLEMGGFNIKDMADAEEPQDAVTLNDLLNTANVTLTWWMQATSLLGNVYASNPTSTGHLIDSDLEELTTANTFFKSTVANTPTPFTILGGTIALTHIEANVDDTLGHKRVTLHTELWIADSDGVAESQIGSDSDTTLELTTSKTAYDIHFHIPTETIIPATKTLFLRIFATRTGSGSDPNVSIYRGDVHNHVSIPVAGSILGNFLPLAGGTMSGDIAMGGNQQVTGLQAPAASGEALRQTTNVTEADLEQLTDGSDTTLHDHDGISENTTHRGSDGSDHSKVGANETAIALNTTHRGSAGGTDHSDVATNTAASHAEAHAVASHNDTTATGTELETLTDNSMADALHRHSELSASDGTPDAAVSVDAVGNVSFSSQSGVSVTLSANQDITHNKLTIVHFTVKAFDNQTEHNTETYTFTAKQNGVYLITTIVAYQENITSGKEISVRVHKNTTQVAKVLQTMAATSTPAQSLSIVLELVTDDTVDIRTYHNYTEARLLDSTGCSLSIIKIM